MYVDKGDTLTPEQIAAAEQTPAAIIAASNEGGMTDDEIAAAVAALTGQKGTNDDDPNKSSTQKTATDPATATTGAGAGAKKAEADPDNDGKGIPTARFNEAVGKERQRAQDAQDLAERLRQENALLRQGIDPSKAAAVALSPEQKIQALEDVVDSKRTIWEEALLNNDKAAAATARAELRKAESVLRTESLALVEYRARTGSKLDSDFDNKLSTLETEFPEINPDSATFDQALSTKLVQLVEGFVTGGMTRLQALEEAAQLYLQPRKQANTTDSLRDAARIAAAGAARTAAPDLATVGNAKADLVPTLKPSRMTAKQYHSLDEATRAYLRGDTPIVEGKT